MEVDCTHPQGEQQGVALLSVLLILVLLATLAIYTAEDEDIGIRRVENQREAEQSFQVAMGAEQWATLILQTDLLADKTKGDKAFDHVSEVWSQLGPPVKVEGTEGTMLLNLYDEQGKFNLNNLIEGKPDPAQQAQDQIANQENQEENQKQPRKVWYQVFKNLLIEKFGIITWIYF